MFAICEKHPVIGGVISRDQGRQWWTGKAWSPAKDEAETFKRREDAEVAMSAIEPGEYLIIEVD